jgi:tRNA nucleotidyltransferase (CCA-adding enzyme)
MKIYLVGGAVRDELLGLSVKERDWVVVGGTQEAMLANGYQQVGKDFPVFLHPNTKEEYALARTERKTAKGYHGFVFDTDISVTMEEDLMRRDLTINAIAKNELGQLIDPYHGVEDLKKKILRHVSPAFSEDPVRILRVARFAARFSDFSVSHETNALMKKMVQDGEVDALVAERVWKEFEKAMSEVAPWRFIEVLEDCSALEVLFPVFKNKKNEILSCLKKISSIAYEVFERIVLMMQSTHLMIEIEKLCKRYRAPKPIFEMVTLLIKYQPAYNNIMHLSSGELLDLFTSLDAFRRESRFKQWLRLCEITTDILGNSRYLLSAFNGINKIELPKDFLKQSDGKAIGKYIHQQRLEKLTTFINLLAS